MFRDLKMENILMDKKGFIRLADFGMAKVLNKKKNKIYIKQKEETEEYLMGTLEYMAPEIFTKKEYGIHTDLWSFGILLYEMLIGNVRYQYFLLKFL